MSGCMLMTVRMNETFKGLREESLKWQEAFERKDLKANFWETKVMVSSGITKDVLTKSACSVVSGS